MTDQLTATAYQHDLAVTRIIEALISYIAEYDPDSSKTTDLTISPQRLLMLTQTGRKAAAKSPSLQSGGNTVTMFNPDTDIYNRFVGKDIFIRNGIFAYTGHCVGNTASALICKDVVWFADTGSYQDLMQINSKSHIKDLSSCKPQWYKPGRVVILQKSLFSDVSLFDGQYAPKENLAKANDMDWWDFNLSNPFENLVGKNIFIRNGIFAYTASLVAIEQNCLICKDVEWYADTGDYQVLLNAPPTTKIGSLSGCKPQWYKPGTEVVFPDYLFSDVFLFDANIKE